MKQTLKLLFVDSETMQVDQIINDLNGLPIRVIAQKGLKEAHIVDTGIWVEEDKELKRGRCEKVDIDREIEKERRSFYKDPGLTKIRSEERDDFVDYWKRQNTGFPTYYSSRDNMASAYWLDKWRKSKQDQKEVDELIARLKKDD